MPAGRPKSPLDLPDGWQNEILNLYADGASDVEVQTWIHRQRGSFSNDLWARWLEEEAEFSETIKLGRSWSESWWNKLGREGAAGVQPVNPSVWIFNMKNRFGWKDKQELSGPDGTAIPHSVEFHVIDHRPEKETDAQD